MGLPWRPPCIATMPPRQANYAVMATSGGPYGYITMPKIRVKKAEKPLLLFQNERKKVQKIKK